MFVKCIYKRRLIDIQENTIIWKVYLSSYSYFSSCPPPPPSCILIYLYREQTNKKMMMKKTNIIFITTCLLFINIIRMKTIFASPLRGLQPTEQLVKRKEIADGEGGMPTGDAVDQSLNNSTETIIPRERLDTQTPEVAEVVSYAMDYINKKVEPKRLARVINIINAFREKRTATDTVAYYTATLHLRRKNGRMEFQDIKVGRSLDSGSLTSCIHTLRAGSAFSMRTRNFGELVTVKKVKKKDI